MERTAFDLPESLRDKDDPRKTAADNAHFAALEQHVAASVAELSARLDEARRTPVRPGHEGADRDREVGRLTARLAVLRDFGLDLCLGRMVREDGSTTYVGRIGVSDQDANPLLVDWRSAAAEPFFAATGARPMGLVSRRRYRWLRGRVRDYWDEVLTSGAVPADLAPTDDSAFIASLATARSHRMRDVLSTVQADQDAIIRADSRGALVVDGGPGTGKTVVALHRTAYLAYADPRVRDRDGVLVIGPHDAYVAYVADVLPSLGEEGVVTCTLRDLVPEGAAAGPEPDADVADLKGSLTLVSAVDAAAQFYEEPPVTDLAVSTSWADVVLTPADWAAAIGALAPGTAHNEARDELWDELISILVDRHPPDAPPGDVRSELRRDTALRSLFTRTWPLLDAADVVGDLWTVPAFLRRCAPTLSAADIHRLQRADPAAWTVADLPLLDAARARLGDPREPGRRRRREAALARERDRMDLVVEALIEADDDGRYAQLRQEGLRGALTDEDAAPPVVGDPLAGPFAHVVVDEAQELTDAEWAMIVRRCPSGSLTVVGDRSQARHGFTEGWTDRLARVGLDRATVATLTVNYRTPREVMDVAEPMIRSVLPDANVPSSIRSSGIPVEHARVSDLSTIVSRWESEHPDGIGCVIGDPRFDATPRVSSHTPVSVKGLEFDLVVLVDPDQFGAGIEGGVDRYVAMTRATSLLVVLDR